MLKYNWFRLFPKPGWSRLTVMVMLLTCAVGTNTSAQGPLKAMGFMQITSSYVPEMWESTNSQAGINFQEKASRSYFSIQQLNVIFRKNMSKKVDTWINFETTNAYSSAEQLGTFSLDEAWIRYTHGNSLRVKVGLLNPQFNNLNEVKNRMPYLPYVTRPVVYEASIGDLLPLGDYVPQEAYFQIYGVVPFNFLDFEYAAFAGNAEKEYFSTGRNGRSQSGIDTTTIVMGGGRIGLSNVNMRAGASFTYDKDNQTATGLGDVPRFRFGGDLSFTVKGIFTESEIIIVRHDVDVPDINLDKMFYYVASGYDFSEAWYSFLAYGYVDDKSKPTIANGMKSYTFGGGWRPSESLVLKFEATRYSIPDGVIPANELIPVPLDLKVTIDTFSIALSAIF